MPTLRRRVTVNLPVDLAAQLERNAAAADLSLSSFIVTQLAKSQVGTVVRQRGQTASSASRSKRRKSKNASR